MQTDHCLLSNSAVITRINPLPHNPMLFRSQERSKVFVLDDKQIWRDYWISSLEGVEVLVAKDLEGADSTISKEHRFIRAAVFDLCVPTIGQNSLEIATRLRSLGGKRVFLVGSTSEEKYRHHLDGAELNGKKLFNEVLVKEKTGHFLQSMARIIRGVYPRSDQEWLNWIPRQKP